MSSTPAWEPKKLTQRYPVVMQRRDRFRIFNTSGCHCCFPTKGTAIDFHSSELIPLLANLSYAATYALLPGLLCYLLDTAGWRSLNRQIASGLSYFASFNIHAASEAIVKSVPLGVPLSDSVRSLMLRRGGGVSLVDGVTTGVSRRLHLGLSQGMFLFVGGVCTLAFTGNSSAELAGWNPGWMALWTGSGLVIALLGARALLSSTAAKRVIERLAGRLPWNRARQGIVSWMNGSRALLTRISGVGILLYFLVWCGELLESYLFVLLLGIPATPFQVVAAELTVSALRLAGFFLPSGIGVQDVGYASALAALGCVPSAVDAVGFVLLKRAKDIFWIVLGYAILLAKGIRPFVKPVPEEIPLKT